MPTVNECILFISKLQMDLINFTFNPDNMKKSVTHINFFHCLVSDYKRILLANKAFYPRC